MIAVGILLFLLPVALALSPDQRIVGGSNADIRNHRWQGSLRRSSGSHTCGCVFVGYTYVLTAAHCGPSSSYSMEFGTSTLGRGLVWGISSVRRHPNFDKGPGFLPNDITILYSKSMIQGSNIYPGIVPSSRSNPGGSGWITGWGQTCGSCSPTSSLKEVKIPIISDSSCASRTSGDQFQSSSMICVYSGSTGSCSGDSGGPMSKNSYIYGLTSWGLLSCNPSHPSVYTRVGAFYSWICSNTGNNARGC